ncbi:winged helix-turn-helix domain-containing protein [Dokdonella sp.]|uniref:winged helix-turn-helix domain-containing protein n=1 Tax=Dokdonella sp. TaxID=2291710 RepID=UPI001B2E7A6B|nr:winged helix-turn-helix domain-containing protein [Dokdonella sp.]MBO9663635.1 winged helix-turn-helix domain-containing protein [Dokdonella sp.]
MKPVRYRFGDYRLDAAARELWHRGEPVAIAPKALECLAYLLEHHDRAVGRDELVAAVWGRVDTGDSPLTQTIWRARRAVGDSDGSGEHGSLRTVPRFGYRWVAPVQVEAIGESSSLPAESAATNSVEHTETETTAPAIPPAANPSRTRPRASRIAAFAALAAVLALAAIAMLARPSMRAAAPAASSADIVVLPVALADSATENAWVRLGAMDYVASRLRDAHLSVLPSERVVALVAAAAADDAGAQERERLAHLTGAAQLLALRASFSEGRWRFAIDAYRDRQAHTFRGEAAAPLQAADLAAAAFLDSLGRGSQVRTQSPGAIEERLQRIDAALLVGDLAEARRWSDDAPDAQRDDPRLRLRSGRIAFRGGRLEDAETAFAPLAGITGETPAAIRAQAQLGLGGIAVRRRQYDRAEPHYTQALTTLGEDGDANLLGRAYNERAVVRGGLGRVDLAIADIGRARSELGRGGDPLGIAYADLNAALIAGQRGRYDEALTTFDRSSAAFERFGIVDGLATSLANKANLQLSLLDTTGAVASAAQAWSLLPRLEDHRLIEFVAQNHIRALRSSGRLAEAGQALDRFEGGGDHASQDPGFAVLRAGLLLDQGKAPLALHLADEILARIERAPVGSCSDSIPQAALVLTEAALQSRRADAAEPLLARLDEFLAAPQDPGWLFVTELARGELKASSGDADADRHFAAALAQADSAGEPADIVTAAAAYAAFLVAHNDRARAAPVLTRLDPYVDRDYRAARAAAGLHALLDQPAPAAAADLKARTLAGERVAISP